MTIASLPFLMDADQHARLSYKTERIPENNPSDRTARYMQGWWHHHSTG
ncbi:MAG: hypothetical protein KME27_18415 [Lyngbya sp. HA4199-MV5]|nr:hypothetical protein [Lyngbya sp. HA4199-MV5]